MSNVTTVYPESTLPVATAISTTLDNDGAHMSNVVNLLNARVSTNNSTDTPLGADEAWIGDPDDVTEEPIINVAVRADQNSAELGLEFQFSHDATEWVTTDSFNYITDGFSVYSIPRVAQWFRIKYTNGATPQSLFVVSTILNKNGGVGSMHRVGDTITDENDGQLVLSVQKAKKPNGTYANISADAQGNLNTNVVQPIGTLPVSQLTTLFDGKIINRNYTEILETWGTGTGAYANNKYNMSVTSGQFAGISSRRFIAYYSGKPQKIEFTFDGFAPDANVTKRAGFFSSSTTSPYSATLDGVWLESSNDSITLKASRAGTETISVDIADWNNYDLIGDYQTLATWDNFTVCEINYLWLGGAYIELRLMVPGVGFVTAHSVIYAGNSPDVFILSPNQMVRYEIRSTTGSGSFRYICNQVATSGSINESAMQKGLFSPQLTLSSIGTTYPVLAVRLGATYRNNPAQVKSVDLNIASNDRGVWTVQINPTIANGTFTWAAVPNSALEQANGNGTLTVSAAGFVAAAGVLATGKSIPTDAFLNNYLSWLSGSITGTQDTHVLCFTPGTSNVAIRGAMNVAEG